MIEPRSLRPQHFRLEKMVQTRFEHRPIGLDPEIMAGSQKVNQPVSPTQAAATDVQHLGLRIESGAQQCDQLEPSNSLEISHGTAQECVLGEQFSFVLQGHLILFLIDISTTSDSSPLDAAVRVPD